MNQWKYFNQRTDEIEKVLNAGNPVVIDESVRKRRQALDDAQLKSADNVQKMLEIMQKNQEKQAQETKKAQSFSFWSLIVGAFTLAATIIFGILQVTR